MGTAQYTVPRECFFAQTVCLSISHLPVNRNEEHLIAVVHQYCHQYEEILGLASYDLPGCKCHKCLEVATPASYALLEADSSPDRNCPLHLPLQT